MNVSGLTSGTTYDCTWSIESGSTGTATLSATNVQPNNSSIKTTISSTGNGSSTTSITVTGKTAGSLKIKATVTDPNSPNATVVSSTTDLTVNTPATPVLTLSTSLNVPVNSSNTLTASVTGLPSNSSSYKVRFWTNDSSISLNTPSAQGVVRTIDIPISSGSASVVVYSATNTAGTATVYAQLWNGTELVRGTQKTCAVSLTSTVTASNLYVYSYNTGNNIAGGHLTLNSSSSYSSPVYASLPQLQNPTRYYVKWTSSNSTVTLAKSGESGGASVTTNVTGNGTTEYVYVAAATVNPSAQITVELYESGASTPISSYTRNFTASLSGSSSYFTLTRNPSSTNTVYLYGYNYDYNNPNYWYDHNYPYYYNRTADFTVTPIINSSSYNNANDYNISYSWTINSSYNSNALSPTTHQVGSSGYTYGGSTCRVDGYYLSGNTSYTLTCTATAYPKGQTQTSANTIRTSTSWTIRTDYYQQPSRFTVSATVNQGETYYLNSTNSGTSTSVIDQISNYIRNNYYYGSSYYNRYLRSISFSTTSHTYGSLSSTSGSYTSSNNFSNLYFTPTTSAIGSSATASFSFTATDDAGQTYYGTLNITVKPGSTSASGFSLTGNQGENLVLSASDFSSWWRGLYSNGTLSYVQFTSVSGGNLYANYSVGGRSNVVSSTNATRCYVNPSSSQTGISSLTFVPSSSTTSSATLSFTAYGTTSSSSSSTVARTSTVSITLRTATVQNVSVRYSSTGGSVPFSYSDFYYSHTSVQTSSYITFGTPSNGSLTAGGSAVSTSTRFSFTGSNSNGYQSISTVTYTPASGYNGTATVPFYAYNTNGGVVANGTVYITVTQPAQPVTPSISFSDVPKNSNTSWYYDCVARLVSNKIVGGYPDGTFKPNGSVTNAEALKLIMLAAGYPSQPNAEANGVPGMWAANYLNAAINAGIVSSSEMKTSDLNKAINRNTIASITAKALKLTPVTDGSNSPFADSKDQWVLALNKAGIIQGTTEASGTTYFYGTQSLTRAQLCLIIERVMNYKQTGSAATPSTPNTPSTPSNGGNNSSSSSNEKPGWLNT